MAEIIVCLKNIHKPDFLYKNLVIEIYGDYHHLHYLYPAKINKNKLSREEQRKYDRKRMKYIRSKGYKTLVILEREIKKDRQKALDKAAKFLLKNKELKDTL